MKLKTLRLASPLIGVCFAAYLASQWWSAGERNHVSRGRIGTGEEQTQIDEEVPNDRGLFSEHAWNEFRAESGSDRVLLTSQHTGGSRSVNTAVNTADITRIRLLKRQLKESVRGRGSFSVTLPALKPEEIEGMKELISLESILRPTSRIPHELDEDAKIEFDHLRTREGDVVVTGNRWIYSF